MKKQRPQKHTPLETAGNPDGVLSSPDAGGAAVGSVAEGAASFVAGAGKRAVASIFLGGALVIAFYLIRLSMTGGTAVGCGPESGCGEVLRSRWSTVFGLPVSLFGAGVYAFLFFAALFLIPLTRAQRRIEAMASMMVLGGALWFTAVQVFILRAFCPWCCAAHALASVGVIVLWRARRGRVPAVAPDPAALAYGALAVVGVVGLAVVQSVGSGPERIQATTTAHAVVAAGGKVSLHDGQVTFDPSTLPTIGLPGATVTTVALTDFTCPHCRELHRTLSQLANERPGQFNTVLLPGSFDPGARSIHRLLLTLWRLEPAHYRQLTEGLVDGSINPTTQELMDRVQQAQGGKFFERAWSEAGWVQDTLKLGDELMALNSRHANAHTLPQFMIGDRVLSGAPHADTLGSLLEAAAAMPAAPAAMASTPPGATAPKVAPTAIPATTPPLAASSPKPVASPGAGAPVISFDSTEIGLGQVPKGESVTKKIGFTNTGGMPLVLKNIKAGCGCTTIQGGQQSVAPGQKGEFEIKLDTTNFAGPITKTVDVESNASNGTVKLFLKVDVWTPVKLSSSSISFGNVLRGSTVLPREVEITVTDTEPLELQGVTSLNPYFHAVVKPLEDGRRYRLTVSVPNVGDRPQNGEIRIALGHAKLKEMKLSAYINPVDPVMVQPRQITVFSSALTAGTTASVTVVSYDPAVTTLDVTDLKYSDGDTVKVRYARKATERWGRVIMEFPAGFVPSAATGTFLTFRTSHPSQPEVKVPVQFMPARSATPPPTSTTPAPPARTTQ